MFTKRETGLTKRITQTQTAAVVEQPTYQEFGVSVLTSGFQLRGTIQSLGTLQTFINNDQRPTLMLYKVEVTGLRPENPATRVTPAELVVNKSACELLALEKQPPSDQMMLLPRTESLVVYTEHFAIQAKFHMGPDARLEDFAEASLQQFIPASDVRIYPLFQVRTAITVAAPVALLHKHAIRLYHKV